jgi:hypothetical protein
MTDYDAQALSYDREGTRDYGRGKRYAQRAADAYASAASARRHAAWLTRRPDLWDDGADGASTPAYWEAHAATLAGCGDLFLDLSFRATESARFVRGLARTYRELAARQRAAYAEAAAYFAAQDTQ